MLGNVFGTLLRCISVMSNEQISLSYLFDVYFNKYICSIFSHCERHASCFLRIYFIIYKIAQPSSRENWRIFLYELKSCTNKYGICIECYTAMARCKGRCSDLKGIVREFFYYTEFCKIDSLQVWRGYTFKCILLLKILPLEISLQFSHSKKLSSGNFVPFVFCLSAICSKYMTVASRRCKLSEFLQI